MSCNKEKSCFYLELGKGIKIVLIVSLIVSLTPSFLENIQKFVNGLNIGSIKTKEFEILFYQKNLNTITEVATKEDVTKEDLIKQLLDIKETGKLLSEKTNYLKGEDFFQDFLKNNPQECANLNLTKEEINNYLGFQIDDSNLASYIGKKFTLLKSIDTHSDCKASYFNPITIKINTIISIKNINKNNLSYNIDIIY